MTAGWNGRFRQRGVALITALLVVAIAGILAVELVWHTNLDLRRTEGLLNWQQAQQYGYLAEEMAKAGVQHAIDQHRGGDAAYSPADEKDLCPGPPFQAEAVTILGRVCDVQGRFNLNNLVGSNGKDKPAVDQFRRLLRAVDTVSREATDGRPQVAIDSQTIETIADSTVDWIDQDSMTEMNGAEDGYYSGLDPPYHCANGWFTDASELLAVRGMTADLYAALSPYIIALPVVAGQRTKINVNTAPDAVLMSLGDNVTLENAQGWMGERETKPFTAATFPYQGFVDLTVFQQYIRYDSMYFQVQARVTVAKTLLNMTSLLEHGGDPNGGDSMRVRTRSFGSIQTDMASSTEDEVTVKDGEIVKADE